MASAKDAVKTIFHQYRNADGNLNVFKLFLVDANRVKVQLGTIVNTKVYNCSQLLFLFDANRVRSEANAMGTIVNLYVAVQTF